MNFFLSDTRNNYICFVRLEIEICNDPGAPKAKWCLSHKLIPLPRVYLESYPKLYTTRIKEYSKCCFS